MEEILQYNYQRKAKFEFFRPELRVRLCFGFWKKKYLVSYCKTLAQLTPSDPKTEKDSS